MGAMLGGLGGPALRGPLLAGQRRWSAGGRRCADWRDSPMTYPWRWAPADVEEWTSNLKGRRRPPRTTCSALPDGDGAVPVSFVGDPRYTAGRRCVTSPVREPHQQCTRSSTSGAPLSTAASTGAAARPPSHVARGAAALLRLLRPARRRPGGGPRVARAGACRRTGTRRSSRPSTRGGCACREASMLDIADWRPTPLSRPSSSDGAVRVRCGRALQSEATPPAHGADHDGVGSRGRGGVGRDLHPPLPADGHGGSCGRPSGAGRSAWHAISHARFAEYRDAKVWTRSLVTPLPAPLLRAPHLLEKDGYDHLFVQQQLGHVVGIDDLPTRNVVGPSTLAAHATRTGAAPRLDQPWPHRRDTTRSRSQMPGAADNHALGYPMAPAPS